MLKLEATVSSGKGVSTNSLDNVIEELKTLSKEMTQIGDSWRDFAVEASRIYKNRSAKEDAYNSIADELLDIANREEIFFKKLKKAIS